MISPELRREMEGWLEGMGLELKERQWEQIGAYLRDVEEHNLKVNLTADSGDLLLLRHIADALAALPALRELFAPAPRLLDLGAGAGFIGMGLKIAWPGADVTLLESSYRKFRFLNYAAARLGVTGLHVIWRTKVPGTFEAVLARAVAPIYEVVALAAGLTRPGSGRLLCYQSPGPDAAEPRLAQALRRSCAALERTLRYRLPRETQDRHLAILKYGGTT